MSDTWIVVPAYNEESVIARVLNQLRRLPYRVLVVDDGSTDGTAARALGFPVILARHPCNLGQGAALETGIRYALEQAGTRYVVTFDSDGQHSVDDIERLLAPL